MAENHNQHRPRRGHAIIADSVGVQPKRQFDIAMAKQSLYGFWVGYDTRSFPKKVTMQSVRQPAEPPPSMD